MSVSNVEITESDPDAALIRDELFRMLPEIVNGQMTIRKKLGWRTDLNENAARAHASPG